MPAVLVTLSSLYSHLIEVPIFTCSVWNTIYLCPLHRGREGHDNVTERDLNEKKINVKEPENPSRTN